MAADAFRGYIRRGVEAHGDSGAARRRNRLRIVHDGGQRRGARSENHAHDEDIAHRPGRRWISLGRGRVALPFGGIFLGSSFWLPHSGCRAEARRYTERGLPRKVPRCDCAARWRDLDSRRDAARRLPLEGPTNRPGDARSDGLKTTPICFLMSDTARIGCDDDRVDTPTITPGDHQTAARNRAGNAVDQAWSW